MCQWLRVLFRFDHTCPVAVRLQLGCDQTGGIGLSNRLRRMKPRPGIVGQSEVWRHSLGIDSDRVVLKQLDPIQATVQA